MKTFSTCFEDKRKSFCSFLFFEVKIGDLLMKYYLNFSFFRREFESKVVLLLHKVLQLSVRQVYYASGPLNDLTKQLSFLASSLHSLGEDKASTGLLGAIGFGKKSQLSVQ